MIQAICVRVFGKQNTLHLARSSSAFVVGLKKLPMRYRIRTAT